MYLLRLLLILLLSFTLGFASIGKISLATGDVSINRDSKILSVKSGAEVFKQDIITTSKESKAQIRFVDNTVISIGNDSSFKVEEYFNDTKKPKAKFHFLKGTFKSITGKIGKIAPQNFNLQTKTATIGIRGTTVVGSLESDGDKIGCLQGAIEVTSLSGGKSVFLGAGLLTSVKSGKVPTKPIKIQAGDLEGFGATGSGNKPPKKEEAPKDEKVNKETPKQEMMAPKVADDVTEKSIDDKSTSELVTTTQTEPETTEPETTEPETTEPETTEPETTEPETTEPETTEPETTEPETTEPETTEPETTEPETTEPETTEPETTEPETTEPETTEPETTEPETTEPETTEPETTEPEELIIEDFKLPTVLTVPLSDTSELADMPSKHDKVDLEGYATSSYYETNENKVVKFDNDSLLNIEFENKDASVEVKGDIKARNTIHLNNSDENTFTYKTINEFSVSNVAKENWIQTLKNDDPAKDNAYVSWGYWRTAVGEADYDKLLPNENLWIAGVNSSEAKDYINTINPINYQYTGKSIGQVYDSSNKTYEDILNDGMNEVKFHFNFGASTVSAIGGYDSTITFQTNTNKWLFRNLSSTYLGEAKFSATSVIEIDNNSANTGTGNINGTFYGDGSSGVGAIEAVGGTFTGTVDTKTAIGVFKAVK